MDLVVTPTHLILATMLLYKVGYQGPCSIEEAYVKYKNELGLHDRIEAWTLKSIFAPNAILPTLDKCAILHNQSGLLHACAFQ